MNSVATSIASTFTITPFVRHSPDCPQKGNAQWKRCKCRKHLYIYEDGKVTYISAKTRSWEQAECVAQVERDKRDPVKIELARIAAAETAKAEAAKAKESSVEDALDQWIAGFKCKPGSENAKAYAGFRKFFLSWSTARNFSVLRDIDADALDAWVGSWDFAPNTQSFRLTKVRSFLNWAFNLRKIDANPAASLRSIKAENEEVTQPLTPAQFEEVIEATYRYDEGRRADKDRFGADLRAVFLVMRWTGVRLVDALMLRRSAVHGNRLDLTIKKSKDKIIDRVVPSSVIAALKAVPVRKTMHPDRFFWSEQCDHRVLSGMWTPRVRLLNNYLHLKGEDGNPLQFHSHMLRDTFAVELLLTGMSLEKVSKLLGHKSVRVTEKHYAPWVKARESQLETELIAAMRQQGQKVTSKGTTTPLDR